MLHVCVPYIGKMKTNHKKLTHCFILDFLEENPRGIYRSVPLCQVLI